MKRIFTLCMVGLCLSNVSKGQGLMSIHRPGDKTFSLKPLKHAPTRTRAEKEEAASNMRFLATTKANEMIDAKRAYYSKFTNQDSLHAAMTDLVYEDLMMTAEDSATQALVDTFNKIVPVKVLATGGISKIEDVKQSTGNLSFGLQFRLSEFRRVTSGRAKNWIDPHYLYIMFNAKTASSSDTNSIQRSFLFPELSRRDFVLGYFWQFLKDDWSIEPTFEGSLNRYADTSNSQMFRSESFLIGAKFAKSFTLPGLGIVSGFQLFPYYNIINVDSKYWTDYTAMVGATNSHPTFHNIGMQAVVQVDKAFIFCNMKYVLNKSDSNLNPDFVRFVYTLGGMVSL
ncbi:MAG: hypothetical protein KF744_11340 [Taibaiella sp.]|nr:hypothetical protein [Taibaiella sp.]